MHIKHKSGYTRSGLGLGKGELDTLILINHCVVSMHGQTGGRLGTWTVPTMRLPHGSTHYLYYKTPPPNPRGRLMVKRESIKRDVL